SSPSGNGDEGGLCGARPSSRTVAGLATGWDCLGSIEGSTCAGGNVVHPATTSARTCQRYWRRTGDDLQLCIATVPLIPNPYQAEITPFSTVLPPQTCSDSVMPPATQDLCPPSRDNNARILLIFVPPMVLPPTDSSQSCQIRS